MVYIEALEIIRESHETRKVKLAVKDCKEGKNFQLQPVLDYFKEKEVLYSFLHMEEQDYNITKEDYHYLVRQENIKLVKE